MTSFGKSDKEIQVTYEDQQQINQFARVNARLQDLQDELAMKKKDLENLTDAEDELILQDDSETVPFHVGEVFLCCSHDAVGELINAAKDDKDKEILDMEARATGYRGILDGLKAGLYAKFGKENINLEHDE